MARRLRIRAMRRKPVDEDKLALAFLLLAEQLAEADGGSERDDEPEDSPGREAA
jgi:hypothetical protein